jgi:hypothetical protein
MELSAASDAVTLLEALSDFKASVSALRAEDLAPAQREALRELIHELLRAIGNPRTAS